ncbi:MAG: hypothetical protein AABY34_06365 [Pseudomonadota bacterium]
MKIRYVFILSFIFLLTGCHHQPDEIYLVKHPEKLKIKIENCRTLGDVELKNTDCMFAEDVFLTASQYYGQLIQNQITFGQQILQKQMELGKIEEQLAENPMDKPLLTQRQQLQYHLNIMRTLVASVTGM